MASAVLDAQRALESQISVVSGEVGQVRSDLRLTTDQLQALRREFQAFVDESAKVALVQQSETKVVNLKAELDRQFGHYELVRRTSTGMLQAFDVGNVSNDVVRSVSEELMIQTPRYWLAPALVALAAWSRDNQDIAEKSVGEAFSRDKNKTSLFFALVMRRQGRVEASVRWLRHYLTSLDPSALTREFAVILEATSYDAFGAQGQAMLSDRMTQWCTELRNRDEIVEAQIGSWVKEIRARSQQLDPSKYQALAALSPQWNAVKSQLESASALPEMIDRYAAVRNHDAALPQVIEDLLDDILDTLVTEYDEEELPLRREVTYHEAIIDERGDQARAQAKADVLLKALEHTDDVVSLQTTAAITPELIGVSVQTQRIAVGVGYDDLRTAVGRYCTAYRGAHVSAVDIELGPGHSNYASTYNFPGWRISTSVPEEQAMTRLRTVWEGTFDQIVDKLRFSNGWYTKPGIIAAVVTLVSFFIKPIIIGFVVLAGAAGIIYLLGEQAKKKSLAAIAAVEAAKEPAIERSISMYRDATAQFVDAELVYEDLDRQEADLLALVDAWPTRSHQKESVA
ncbi:MAG: hypothetical protein IPH27_11435 [Actinomycetales bacterium]|nr:hypothetical protein [Candidatus Phosphoribacter baldrii]MBK6956023.1 hypothetical protein [Candidatus Phosphoribacter baldrii]